MHVAGKGFDARKCRPAILVVLCLEHWVTRTKPRASRWPTKWHCGKATADSLSSCPFCIILYRCSGMTLGSAGALWCFHIFHVNERLLERETHQKRKTSRRICWSWIKLPVHSPQWASSSVLLYRLNSCTTCLAKPDKWATFWELQQM